MCVYVCMNVENYTHTTAVFVLRTLNTLVGSACNRVSSIGVYSCKIKNPKINHKTEIHFTNHLDNMRSTNMYEVSFFVITIVTINDSGVDSPSKPFFVVVIGSISKHLTYTVSILYILILVI